jgi:type IV pilus assembly protein PilC
LANFNYTATDSQGRQVSGSLQAPDRNAALLSLSTRYMVIGKLDELKPRRSFVSRFISGKVSNEDILSALQQLSVAVSAGVRIKSCLDTMSQDSSNPRLQAILMDLSNSLNSGASFSDAMARHPEVFAKFQVKLVKAGEASGKLAETLRRVADDMEGRELLFNQVRSAVAYPAFTLVVAIVLSAGLLAWGVPQVDAVYKSMGAPLPAPTRVLVFIGESLSSYWWVWLVAIFLAIRGFIALTKFDRFAAMKDDFLLSTYPFGAVYRFLSVAFFARTLGLLYRSGLPLNMALEILAEAATSARFREVLETIKERVLEGSPLSSAMRYTNYFPPMAAEMVATGEQSGSLEKMLDELDRFYSRRCELALKTLTSLLEPMLTVAVGIILGGIIIGLGLPFLNMPALMM